MTKQRLIDEINKDRIITEQLPDEMHDNTEKYCPFARKGQCYKISFGYQNCPLFQLRLKALGITKD